MLVYQIILHLWIDTPALGERLRILSYCCCKILSILLFGAYIIRQQILLPESVVWFNSNAVLMKFGKILWISSIFFMSDFRCTVLLIHPGSRRLRTSYSNLIYIIHRFKKPHVLPKGQLSARRRLRYERQTGRRLILWARCRFVPWKLRGLLMKFSLHWRPKSLVNFACYSLRFICTYKRTYNTHVHKIWFIIFFISWSKTMLSLIHHPYFPQAFATLFNQKAS